MRQARMALYRQQAAGIRAKVENMKDQAMREQFLDIARQYEALATSIARLPLPRDD